MLIEVLAFFGLIIIWLANCALLYGFGIFGGLLLEDMIIRDLGWVGFMRSLANIFLFCATLFFVAYVALVSMDLTKKYFQSRDTKVTIEMYLPSFEIEKK